MSEGIERFKPGIESITMDKETSMSFSLGENGPVIEVKPSEEAETGLIAVFEGQTYQLREGSNTIGRLESSDIIVNLPTVSRTHAFIIVGDHEYSVNDAGSTNGTFLA